MEVASPLTTLGPNHPGGGGTGGGGGGVLLGNKRTCSPQLLCPDIAVADGPDHNNSDRMLPPSSKRRRFHTPSEIDSLSADFSSHTLFFNSKNVNPSSQQKSVLATNGASSFIRRVRMPSSSPTIPEQHYQQQQHEAQKKHEELERVIQEQASLIESLQADKVGIEKSFASLKSDHDRITKDNGILRKAVTIQEERRLHLEQEVKTTNMQSDDRIKGLEQIILTLRYHLQAAQSNFVANDFMHQRPPDVY